MWTSDSMTIMESFQTFLIGFSVVFICLIALAIFVILTSKIIEFLESRVKKENSKDVQVNKVASNDKDEGEDLAIIIAVISEELNLPTDKFKIVNIKKF